MFLQGGSFEGFVAVALLTAASSDPQHGNTSCSHAQIVLNAQVCFCPGTESESALAPSLHLPWPWVISAPAPSLHLRWPQLGTCLGPKSHLPWPHLCICPDPESVAVPAPSLQLPWPQICISPGPCNGPNSASARAQVCICSGPNCSHTERMCTRCIKSTSSCTCCSPASSAH